MNEFDLIERFFLPLSRATGPDSERFRDFAPNEDCALITVGDTTLAFSSDTLKEGVHFHADMPLEQIAYRAMATAFSDLAAANARPECALLNLSLPNTYAQDQNAMEAIYQGIDAFNSEYGARLIGGDTVAGELAFAVTCFGVVQKQEGRHLPLRRGAAKPDDLLFCVSPDKSLGLAGLRLHPRYQTLVGSEKSSLDQAFFRPKLGFAQASRLAEYGAKAAMDISDGLIADLSKFAKRSRVSFKLDVQRLPISEDIISVGRKLGLTAEQLVHHAMTFGDDYALLVTLPDNKLSDQEIALLSKQDIYLIGKVSESVRDGSEDERALDADRRSMIDCAINDHVVLFQSDTLLHSGQYGWHNPSPDQSSRQHFEQALIRLIHASSSGFDHFQQGISA